MIGETGRTAVIGAIGEDKYGELYSELMRNEGIVPLFEKIKGENTGVCAVYCNNKDRGHVTDLGASTKISEDMLTQNNDILQNAELIFTELFILKHKRDMVFRLAEIGLSSRKTFGFNIPSFYFIETYFKEIKTLFTYSDIVFTNAAEAMFYSDLCEFEESDNLAEICKFMAASEKKNQEKKRVVIITNGPNPAYVAQYDFTKEIFTFYGTFPVAKVEEEKIVDANGAGDAFAGGFLAMYMNGKNMEDCVIAGHWAASKIIQVRGCQFPKNCDFVPY